MYLQFNNNFLVHRKKNIVIIWSAKCASVIINKMFFEEENLLDEALQYSNWIHDYREKYIVNTSLRRNYLINQPKTLYLQFVRNPYSRVVSSYLHAMKHNLYCKSNKNHKFNNINFLTFLKYLKNGNIKSNIHHQKQTFFLNRNILPFRIEELGKSIKIINKRYNLNYKIHNSSHHYEKKNIEKYVGNLNWNDLKNNVPKKYFYFYNKESKELVEELYKEDFINFKYTWNMFLNEYI